MKGKRMLFGVVALCTVLIMAQASVSNADTYSGAWLPNDVDAFLVAFANPLVTDPDSFFMYDWGNESARMEVFGSEITQTVYFTQKDGIWSVRLSGGTETLNLGKSSEFGFFFGDGTTMYYDLTVIEPGEMYQLSPAGSSDITICTSDIAPVPLPASALLLGSGMVGLIAFGRVRLRGIFS